MLKNYLLLALKHFRKQKMFSLINILGLTVSMTCCLMIFLYIMNEFSFDRFHKNADQIYRIMRVGHVNGTENNIPWVSPAYGPALLQDYPDAIEKMVRVNRDNDLITYKEVSFNEKNIFLVDTNFFHFFSFKLLKGNPSIVLSDPLGMVMTASTAKKYFGDEDPIGKIVKWNKDLQFKVTGIAADPPVNSHLEFDIVVANTHWQNSTWYNQWPNNGLFVYLQLKPNADPAKLMKRFPAFMDKYLGAYYRENGFSMGLTMHALKDIYFESDGRYDNVKHGNRKMVYIFMSIAFLVLLIACINFMNLATARASDRSKEVGLRKVMGALRRQLAWQFIFESLFFAFVAAGFSLLLLQAILPAYNNFLGYKLPSYWANPLIYVFLFGTILVVGLLAGSYPALLLSSFSPIESLKGKLKTGTKGTLFRQVLVVFQFGISVLLMVSVAIIMKQMHYVEDTDMGFDKQQTMIIRLDNGSIWDNKIHFKRSLEADPAVVATSLMSGEPGGFHDSYNFEAQGKPGEKPSLNTEYADFEYVKTLGLKVIAGRALSAQFPTDTVQSVLINRTAATQLGYTPEQAVGTWIRNINKDSARRSIVGVVEDFHFASLKQTINGLVIAPNADDRRLILVKLHAGKMKETVDRIGKMYTTNAAGYPFEYSFLDERFNNLYKTESKQQQLLTVFSIIAIVIACLGLFGLASYTAVKRTREIGVRKVLGSSVENIVLLLSKDLLKPVLLGAIIAVPAGYYVMHQWLEGFAYRINIEWWLFALAAFTALAIAIITVSYQAIRAALANPVKSLRTE